MKKLTFIAGIAAAAMLAAGTAQARTMTDAEFFANLNDLAYDDQQSETVEFARMELAPSSGVSTGGNAGGTGWLRTMTDDEFFANINDLAYDDQSLETVEFARMELGPISDVSTTSGKSVWVSIIHDPLYSEAD